MEQTPIKPFYQAAIALKREIRAAVEGPLQAFTAATGIAPSAIRICMVDVTSTSDELKQFVLGPVRIDFEGY